MENIPEESIWSDFTGTGASQDDYVNGNSETINSLGLDYAWNDGVTFDKQCVQMNFENDFALEPADCSLEAKYVCVKSVCPQGFEWYDSKSCVKLMDTTASKSNAMSSCTKIHPRASLLAPKSANDQMLIKNYLKRKSFKDSLFLGAEMNENGHWHWDDGNPLFVSGNNLKYYIFSQPKVFISSHYRT